MNVTFNPSDQIVNSYDYCRFTFQNGHISHWGTIPSSITVGDSDTQHSILTTLPRVNAEYNSPLLDGEFPEDGCFSVDQISIITEDDQSQSIVLNKIFMPKDCIEAYLYNADEVAECTITREYSTSSTTTAEANYAVLMTFSSQPDTGVSSEILRHELNTLVRTDYGFEFGPHELQINGSEILISFKDLQEAYRNQYMNNNYIACPEFQNFSLARNYSKFYIGTPSREV